MATAKATPDLRLISFDEYGKGTGIVFKRELDGGSYELPAAFESMLAARYALVEGVVTDAYPELSDEEVIEQLRLDEEARAKALVDEKRALNPVLTRLQFMELFTPAELEAIYTAAKQSVAVEVYLDKLKIAENVDLSNPSTIAGIDTLAAVGILTAERAAEIKANKLPA